MPRQQRKSSARSSLHSAVPRCSCDSTLLELAARHALHAALARTELCKPLSLEALLLDRSELGLFERGALGGLRGGDLGLVGLVLRSELSVSAGRVRDRTSERTLLSVPSILSHHLNEVE